MKIETVEDVKALLKEHNELVLCFHFDEDIADAKLVFSPQTNTPNLLIIAKENNFLPADFIHYLGKKLAKLTDQMWIVSLQAKAEA